MEKTLNYRVTGFRSRGNVIVGTCEITQFTALLLAALRKNQEYIRKWSDFNFH